MDPTDTADPRAWIGRTETAHDRITATPVRALAASLDHPDAQVPEAMPLPPLWHWLFFLPLHRASELGDDGHARRGGFLPPVPLPRRMWAGGRFEFDAPLCIGEAATRRSTIENVVRKEGRNGPLVFVTVRHEFGRDGGGTQPALVEWHDIVYRDAKRPGEVEPPPQRTADETAWQHTLVPDAVLLFRYSALTFNSHRIHYDRRYVVEVEGYPGLVVHGPLIATLLMDLLRRHLPRADVATFAFKALRPAFDGQPLALCGRQEGRSVRLWAQDSQGWLLMDASATLRGN